MRITGPGTDISFSIKGLPAIPCAGECNLPDGEVFTAPVIDSANGRISFNTPSLFQGIPFDNISLTLENGLVVHAEAGDKTAELNSILDTDPGARRLGGIRLRASIRPSPAPCATSCLTRKSPAPST